MSMIQPFGVKLYRGIWKAHRPFFAKTVMVKDGDVDHAMRLLNKMLSQEGIIDIIRRTKYFEKPWKQRNRISYEKCKAIYDEDMSRKIKFLMRKNRTDPFPGQY